MKFKFLKITIILLFCLACRESAETEHNVQAESQNTNIENRNEKSNPNQNQNNSKLEDQDTLFLVLPGDTDSYNINEELQFIATKLDDIKSDDEQEEDLNLVLTRWGIFRRKSVPKVPNVPKTKAPSPVVNQKTPGKQTPTPGEDVLGELPVFEPKPPRQYTTRHKTSNTSQITPDKNWKPFSFPLSSGKTTVSRNQLLDRFIRSDQI
ncbi:MAG: hypothetical protein AB8G05_08325 [Oligoflexales bacterium]